MILHLQHDVPHCQIDDFPEGCQRSVKGALHLSANSTKEMTPDEWAHIKATRPDVASKIRVALDDSKKPAPPAPASVVEDALNVAAEEKPMVGEKKNKNRG